MQINTAKTFLYPKSSITANISIALLATQAHKIEVILYFSLQPALLIQVVSKSPHLLFFWAPLE